MRGQNELSVYYNGLSSDRTKRVILHVRMNKPWNSDLYVYNIQRHKTRHVVFNMSFDGRYTFTKLDLNRQGTMLLVRYFYFPFGEAQYDADKKGVFVRRRQFFQLNGIVHYQKSNGKKKEENVLQEYLRHHLVCKKII